MLFPALPDNEEQRLHALYQLAILDTPREDAYDCITEMACDIFHVPVALITMVDVDRLWFKSAIGVDISGTIRALSFSAHTILHEECLVIEDTLTDEGIDKLTRFIGNTRTRKPSTSYKHYRSPPVILKYAVWLYY